MAMRSKKGRKPSVKRKSIDLDSDSSTTHIGLDGNSLSQLIDKWDAIQESEKSSLRRPLVIDTSKYAPTFDTVVLYARLAKTNRRFYHTDSAAVVNTIAEQLGKSPLQV